MAQVIPSEQPELRDHATEDQSLVRFAHLLSRLDPPDDEHAGEQHGHDLADVRSQRRCRSHETRSFEKFLHLTPWTKAERSSSSTDVNPASFNHWTASAMV